jgi:WD40 repeat protein
MLRFYFLLYFSFLFSSTYAQPKLMPKVQIGHTGIIEFVCISQNNRWVATADMDQVKVWDVKTGREIFSTATKGDVTALAFSPENLCRWKCTSRKNCGFGFYG